MKKNRYLLCLLLCGALLYFAVPRMNIFSSGLERVFSIFWLIFALMVLAGNLTALLYVPKKVNSSIRARQALNERKRARSLYRNY